MNRILLKGLKPEEKSKFKQISAYSNASDSMRYYVVAYDDVLCKDITAEVNEINKTKEITCPKN